MTSKSKQNIRDIYYYISDSLLAKNAANRLVKKIKERTSLLNYMPKSHSIIQGIYREEYRKLIINNYIAVYRIDEEKRKIYVIEIIYGGRNYYNKIYE